jgi:hypothetical protein
VRNALALVFITALAAALGGGHARAAARTPGTCIVPRLYTLTPAAAEAQVTRAGCDLGRIVFQRPRSGHARVTGQLPLPGATLPRRTRVVLLVS